MKVWGDNLFYFIFFFWPVSMIGAFFSVIDRQNLDTLSRTIDFNG